METIGLAVNVVLLVVNACLFIVSNRRYAESALAIKEARSVAIRLLLKHKRSVT